MSILRWFSKNWANTLEPTHPDLRPLEFPVDPAVVLGWIREIARGRWRLDRVDDTGTIHLTRRTRMCRFVDDIEVMLRPAAGGSLVHASSRSRLGKGDLGQNRRNILELWSLLKRRAEESTRSNS